MFFNKTKLNKRAHPHLINKPKPIILNFHAIDPFFSRFPTDRFDLFPISQIPL